MRQRFLSRVLWLVVFSGCGAPSTSVDGGFPGPDSNDIVPPRIVATSPEDGVTQVLPTSSLSVEFSEPVDRSRLTLILEPAAPLGPPSWSRQDSVASFVPTAPLAMETRYLATVGARDLHGLELSGAASFSFTTAGAAGLPPGIASTVPANGATGVAAGASISITFTRPMEISSVQLSLNPAAVLGAPNWSASNETVTYGLPAPLAADTAYQAAVQGRSAAGLPLPAGAGFSFRTATPNVPPTVVSTTPANGAAAVRPSAPMVVAFSQPMDRPSVEAAFSSSPAIPCSFGWDAQSTQLTCTAALASFTSYAITVGTGATDRYGNRLAASYQFSFTTGDGTPPTLISSYPPDKQVGVLPETYIQLRFSEAMDKVATQAAFSITSPAGVTGTFQWNAATNRMTFRPSANLPYGASVAWSISSAAKDAAGNPLAAASRSFKVAVRSSIDLPSIPALDGYVGANGGTVLNNTTFSTGDDATNQEIRGFLSFSLVSLPIDLVRIESATLNVYQVAVLGNPYGVLGGVQVQSVPYGTTLEAADFSAAAVAYVGALSASATLGWKQLEATSPAQNDWAYRASRSSLSQFRLSCPTATNADASQDLSVWYAGEASTSTPFLHLEYLSP